MDLTIAVGVIAAAAAILSATITAQRVPAHIRELEKLALAAGAIHASPETETLLDHAIREAIPEPRIRSIWPEVLRVSAFGSGGASIGIAVLALVNVLQGLRWDLVAPTLLVSVICLVLMPVLVVAREAVLRALGSQRERQSAWRDRVIGPAEDSGAVTRPRPPRQNDPPA